MGEQATGPEWRPIPGWEGLYEITSGGRVRSLERVDSRGAWHGVAELRGDAPAPKGRVALCRDGARVRYCRRELVAAAWGAGVLRAR